MVRADFDYRKKAGWTKFPLTKPNWSEICYNMWSNANFTMYDVLI